jgi:hypothetical protein
MQLAPSAVKQNAPLGKGKKRGSFVSGPISNPHNIPSRFADPFQTIQSTSVTLVTYTPRGMEEGRKMFLLDQSNWNGRDAAPRDRVRSAS